eukprot:8993271-Alexandrium_andersonii.AAC.1
MNGASSRSGIVRRVKNDTATLIQRYLTTATDWAAASLRRRTTRPERAMPVNLLGCTAVEACGGSGSRGGLPSNILQGMARAEHGIGEGPIVCAGWPKRKGRRSHACR